MNRNRTLAIAALATVAAITGGVMLRCEPDDPLTPTAHAQAPAPAVTVQTTRPKRRNVSRLITLPGDVSPMQEAVLYAKVPGYLESIFVDKGDRVRAGQVLATLQTPELQADKDQAQQLYRSMVASAQGSRAADERTVVEQGRARTMEAKAQADYVQALANVEKAGAQLAQAQAAAHQAQEQKDQEDAALEESEAQVHKAEADLETARADQHLADLTFERYQGIYTKNPMLIARQDVDVAESKARAAQGKTEAAQSQVEAARRHMKAAQAQVKVTLSQIEQAQDQVAAAREQVSVSQAQQTALKKQLEAAAADVKIAGKQQEIARAKAQETEFQAQAARNSAAKLVSVANYARIRAPFDGIVIKRYVDPGAFIQTAASSQNAEPIVTVADLASMRVYFNIPEAEALFVHPGTQVTLTTRGLAELKLKGQVKRTSMALDPKTRTLLAEVDIPNHDHRLLTGAYALGRIVMETHTNVLSVPSVAVGSEKAGKFLWVVENGRAKHVPVIAGFDDGLYTEIAQGLQEGAQVIAAGQEGLTPGVPVQITPWMSPQQP